MSFEPREYLRHILGEADYLIGRSKYGVTRLELFGSAARGDFEPGRSDLDFLVEFGPESRTDLFHRYFGLREDLENLLGCGVDLVMLSALKNPYFVRSVNESRAVLYAA